jgi:hypothetical protein
VGGSRGAPRTFVRLAASGRPAAAIVWKNVTGALREFRLRSLLLLVILIVAVGSALGSQGSAAELVAVLALSLSGLALLFGPLTLRYDLRRDLELLDMLKTYPLRGREVVAAEVLAPALVLSGVVWFGIVLAFIASLASNAPLPAVGDRVALLVAALALVPPVLTVLLLVQNAAVVLFPAWIAIGPDRPTGFEATGQRILNFVGGTLALLIAVLPAGLVGGVVALVARGAGADPLWTAAIWAVVAAIVLSAETYLGMLLLGPVLERLEPAGLR